MIVSVLPAKGWMVLDGKLQGARFTRYQNTVEAISEIFSTIQSLGKKMTDTQAWPSSAFSQVTGLLLQFSFLTPHAPPSCRSIDVSEAQKVPGFVCFLSADDIPGSNETGLFNDETVFAKDKVYLGFFFLI